MTMLRRRSIRCRREGPPKGGLDGLEATVTLRPAAERGPAEFGWLSSRHSFSFGHYYDPQHMGFGALRVINKDRVAPGAGFDPHGHRTMEIISYVYEGSLEHEDSMGNRAVFPAKERQGRPRLVGSSDAREGPVTIHQDVDLYAGLLAKGEAVSLALRPGRQAWLQVARGRLDLNGRQLGAGDGAAITGEDELRIKGVDDAELLLFDLAS